MLCLLLALACGKKGGQAESGTSSVPDAGRAPVARLMSKTGVVRLSRGGTRVPAEPGTLLDGDALETELDGDGVVRFTNGRQVEVGPQAHVLLAEDGTGGVVAVSNGTVLSREETGHEAKQEGPRGQLSLLTPYGLARLLSAEDQAKVEVTPEAGTIEVLQGHAEVTPKTGRVETVAHGQVASLTGSGLTVSSAESASVPMQVLSASGQVTWRHDDREPWRAVEGEDEALKDGGSVRVSRGDLVLRLGGGDSKLELLSGGEMMVVGVARRGTTDEARLDLIQGQVRLTLLPGSATRLVFPGLSVESPLGARFDVRRGAEGYTLTAYCGDVTLVRGTQREPLNAGRVAIVSGSSPIVYKVLEKAPLALASAEGQKVYHQHLSEVALTWAEPGEVRVEVAEDEAFQELVLTGVARGGFVNVDAPMEGALYWRVRGSTDSTSLAHGSAFFEAEPSGRARARAPALALSIPHEGQRSAARVRAVGTFPEGATLTVNGQPAALDARHRFDFSVAPVGQPPMLVFKLSRSGAPDVYTVRVLK